MSNLILIIKAIVAIQRVLDQVTSLIIESRHGKEREELHAAVQGAKIAKTRDEKIEAARRIQSAFKASKRLDVGGRDSGDSAN